MEKECTSFELTLNDDEYLTSVFFEFSDGYFACCRITIEDDEIYYEMNDQANSVYSNDCQYCVENDSVRFEFTESVSNELNCDSVLTIHYKMTDKEVELLKKCLVEIFSCVSCG
ncbi:hypothetical protein [Bacteroides cellulosilyticus]|uniref:hypothetical protein n=1 Tax=Bacteroides cellulosilyticus TaxID=246787 RepID=UPI0032EF9918